MRRKDYSAFSGLPREPLADHHRSLPPSLRQLIVDLKAEYSAFSLREIAQICYVQFGRRPSQPTIKQVLADGPPPSRKDRRFPAYSEITDLFERRRAIIALHVEGWAPASIADYLGLSRSTTYDLLKRFQEEGLALTCSHWRKRIYPTLNSIAASSPGFASAVSCAPQ